MDSTLIKGITTELDCIRSFIAMGFQVSIPYGDCARYDFIADDGNKLYKVQCKSSSWTDETKTAFKFECRSTRINSQGVKKQSYDETQIDYFATFFEGRCYVVHVSECSTTKTLRLIPPKNGQSKGITFAKDQEISVFLFNVDNGKMTIVGSEDSDVFVWKDGNKETIYNGPKDVYLWGANY